MMRKLVSHFFLMVCSMTVAFMVMALPSFADVASLAPSVPLDVIDQQTRKVPHNIYKGKPEPQKQANETLKVGPFYFHTKEKRYLTLGLKGQSVVCIVSAKQGDLNLRTKYLQLPGEPGNYDVLMQTSGDCLSTLEDGTKLGSIRVERQACGAGQDGYAQWSHNSGFDVMRALGQERRDETKVSCTAIRGVSVPIDKGSVPYCLSDGSWNYEGDRFCRYCRADQSFADTAPTDEITISKPNHGQWRRACNADGSWEEVRKYCLAEGDFPETMAGEEVKLGMKVRSCTENGWEEPILQACAASRGLPETAYGKWAEAANIRGYCNARGQWQSIVEWDLRQGRLNVDTDTGDYHGGYTVRDIRSAVLIPGLDVRLSGFKLHAQSPKSGCANCAQQVVFGFEGATAEEMTCINRVGNDAIERTHVDLNVPSIYDPIMGVFSSLELRVWSYQAESCLEATEMAVNNGGGITLASVMTLNLFPIQYAQRIQEKMIHLAEGLQAIVQDEVM